ncbi:MAG: ABC transporter ATP-binding protein [Bryobacterales bacterium]|nr:ABC transporter ATP-binding protein [Bryobacterales bacterium]
MIEVQNVSKVYPLYQKPIHRLVEAVVPGGRRLHRDFHALRNVSLRIERGEVAAFIGPNGSGKSTLLQIICGVIPPSAGRVLSEGRIASLLELGAGFNPELTGAENVRINAEVMGLSRAAIDKAFPRIAEFAGVGDFLYRPVKEYSSGMYVRLAFATAIHVEPDILIVDEALAVGDAVFANRCIRKFEEFRQQGVTILFVSHDLALVKQLANRAWFLYQGQVLAEGAPSDVVNRYVGMVLAPDGGPAALPEAPASDPRMDAAPAADAHSHRHGDGASRIRAVELADVEGNPVRVVEAGQTVQVIVEVEFLRAVDGPMAGFLLRNRNGLDVFGTNTRVEGLPSTPAAAGERRRFLFTFPCRLPRNEYTLTVASQYADGRSQDWRDDLLRFSVANTRAVAGLIDLEVRVAVETPEVTGASVIAPGG